MTRFVATIEANNKDEAKAILHKQVEAAGLPMDGLHSADCKIEPVLFSCSDEGVVAVQFLFRYELCWPESSSDMVL